MKITRSRLVKLPFFICLALCVCAQGQLMQVAELTASDGQKNDFFGGAVALSGGTAVVGAESATRHEGAAYVFENTGGTWTQVAKLTASDASRNQFLGSSVAISSDGNTIVASAPGNTFKPGAVYVFVKPPSGWVDMTETAKLTVDKRIAVFGKSVAINSDGSKVVAISNSFGGFVFVEPPGGWINMTQQKAILEVATGGAAAAAISGNTVALGVNGFNGSNGAVLVYVLGPGSHMPQIQPTATLTGSDPACAPLGVSLAMNSDTIASGAPFVTPGSVCVFVKPPSGWTDMTQSAELSLSPTAISDIGFSAAMSGHTIVTGATLDSNGPGSSYGYAEPPTGWTNTTTPNLMLTSGDGAVGDNFGWSISASGTTIIVGAPFHAVNGNTVQGAAYVFGQ